MGDQMVPALRFKDQNGQDYPDCEAKILGYLLEVKTGNKDTKDAKISGKYPFFVRSNNVQKINTYSLDCEAILTTGDGVGVGKNYHYINGKFDFHQRVYCLYNFKIGIEAKFIFYLFTTQFRRRVQRLSAKNSVDSVRKDMIVKMPVITPSLPEQQKIADFLSSVDKKIEQLTRKKELLEKYKTGMMQKLFPKAGEQHPELRFKDENGQDFPDWEEIRLGDCLDYTQPTKYLVNNTDYDDTYETPVLTAGKTFVLGYTNEKEGIYCNLPAIIFDDFTTASKYVAFPFKAKSSAMKILNARHSMNIRFLYGCIENLKFEVGGHKRHWISIFSELLVFIPSNKEQQKIADFLSAIDDKITKVEGELTKAQTFKKGLLQQMFV